MSIKPYLQLVRLPNLFTAAADSLAGWLIVRGTLDDPARWLPLLAISVLVYAGGIVHNDLCDLEIDRVERPARPLPSGRVSPRTARIFAALAFLLAIVLGITIRVSSGQERSRSVTLGLCACVYAYNMGLKRTQVGPIAMGACRSLNLLLGLSVAPDLGGPNAWLVAASYGLFVAGVTWISRSEVGTGRIRGIALGVAVQAIAMAGLAVGAARLGSLGSFASGHPWQGLPVLGAVAFFVGRADIRALRRPEPGITQRAVKTGVLSLVWLDVALVAASQGTGLALAVAALWIPAFVLGRWLYST